ncbi:poly-beta-1,6-N-acetyl-D-glucosamine N-deacetylase PgaB [Methylomonas paludis]|uniref:Poly-beta-1,6-N-acetyl-D-glucosamine N-deacetylase PgaB n=1 Tax=Methylomonas paludis TaxID=1173101 RepID=A0A975MP19_9GAMM|nr:poly-beta-1,6-N-acetyl-D-glucosamine N-deacetylase PgaB [Methylomonas paludis]QWF71408.1 poly-beta-1,6-N-acetyl-D-glucosamine N-deacetylase PgaB [Methylomonas paludis]
MRIFARLIFTIACLLVNVAASADTNFAGFLVLNYHDILEEEERVPPFDRIGVNKQHLEQHFAWLKKNNYHVISVQDVLDARQTGKSLPDKAVMLTFDDGYQSFFTRAMPLLKKYHYSATLAVVGSWLEQPASYEGSKPIMSTAQIREVMETGLVEIASHTHDLHHSIPANPQANMESAVTSRLYSSEYEEYENDESYRKRIFQEIDKSSEHLFQLIGKRPRVLVWPYGEYNAVALEAAKLAGMSLTMGLSDGLNSLADFAVMKRLMIADDPNVAQFAEILKHQRLDQELRVVHVDLDYIYDEDEAQTKRNLSALLDRIKTSGANTVYLQAYSDPDGDGNADQLYFPNRHLPVRRDLFNHVAWQLRAKAGVKVYAWMPIMAYKADVPLKWYVKEWRDGEPQLARHVYTRLSPFNPEARQFVGEIYEDLAKYCDFNGILFHDDGILSDFEDVSQLAMDYTHNVWGLPAEFEQIHASSALRLRWAQQKTELIAQFTDYLADKVRYYRPNIKTARNFYALPLLKPYSEEWYAQSFPAFLMHYDYVAIEAMPFMENAADPKRWLTELVQKTAAYPHGLDKMVFELQAVDWAKQQDIAMPVFIEQFQLLKKNGAKHIGYYPDNVYHDQPRLDELKNFFPTQKKY